MTKPEVMLVVAPILILLSTLWSFSFFVRLFGIKRGYLAGFVFYWLGWGFLFPLAVLGGKGLTNLFASLTAPPVQLTPSALFLLAIPPVLAGVTVFRKNRARITAEILWLSAGLALLNGALEELLWRGTYLTVFPDRWFWGLLYPAVGFALWHWAPQRVRPSKMPGGVGAFLMGAFFLGLCWGGAAWQTQSILFTIPSHVLTDFLGLGGLIYVDFKNV
ncbi:CPBP family glutamic-type intramembrane protease [Calditrichota bacterium GD2]